jgi:hypothetical protein
MEHFEQVPLEKKLQFVTTLARYKKNAVKDRDVGKKWLSRT